MISDVLASYVIRGEIVEFLFRTLLIFSQLYVFDAATELTYVLMQCYSLAANLSVGG
jgi:hypothetical protein